MERKQGFWRQLSPSGKNAAAATFYMYFHLGMVAIMIGSLLPLIQAEYALSYRVGGLLLSAVNVGQLLAGALCGLLTVVIGIKKSILALCNLLLVGLFVITRTGNAALLLLAMLLIGVSKGATANYNNLIISNLSHGSARPLNLLHACFAIGACIAPFIVLLSTSESGSAWRAAVYVALALGVVQVFLQCRMSGDVRQDQSGGERLSFGFLKERPFRLSVSIMFCYQAVEASLMGWLVSYFLSTGAMASGFAQALTSLLWASLLIGRLICAAAAGRFAPKTMILVMCGGMLLFFFCLMLSKSFLPMVGATIGLGLCMSGMYGTTVSNAGDVFARYPLAMGAFVAVPGLGAALSPTLIGALADGVGLKTAMRLLFIFAGLGLVLALINDRRSAVRPAGSTGEQG